MALDLELTQRVDNNGKRLVLTDVTGAYNAVSNTGGWHFGAGPAGANTPYIEDVVYATVTITDTSGSSVELDIINTLGITFDATTAAEDLVYNISNTHMGYSTSTTFADGIYKLVYKVSDGAGYTGNKAEKTFFIGLYYDVELALFKNVYRVTDYYNCNRANNQYVNDVKSYWLLFQGLKHSAKCGDMGAFQATLDTLTSIADIQDFYQIT